MSLKPLSLSAALLAFSVAGTALAQSAEAGRTRYEATCLGGGCHGPRLVTSFPSRDLRARVRYDFPTFRGVVRTGRSLPLPAASMPAFSATAQPDRDLCSIYLYIRENQPGVGPDPSGLCLPPPPPIPPPPPPPPPPPELPAPPTSEDVVASRRNFFPRPASAPRGSLVCEGGGDASIVTGLLPGRSPVERQWRMMMNFVLTRGPYAPGTCQWLGTPPTLPPARPGVVPRVRFMWDVSPVGASPFSGMTVHVRSAVSSAAFDVIDRRGMLGSGPSSLAAVYDAIGTRDALIIYGGALGGVEADGTAVILVDEAAATRRVRAP